ncbi:hypothetical protein BN440_3181 [Erwinia amylovora MR1]|nr:hypothetical protein BN440_3181 [Erwinia amylovora MR1]
MMRLIPIKIIACRFEFTAKNGLLSLMILSVYVTPSAGA